MQLPPEEDRQPHHEALIVDTKKIVHRIYLKKLQLFILRLNVIYK